MAQHLAIAGSGRGCGIDFARIFGGWDSFRVPSTAGGPQSTPSGKRPTLSDA